MKKITRMRANKSCAAESSDSFLNFFERESTTTNEDADNQEIEVRKIFAIKLVREAIERILVPEVQDQSSDDQSVTSEGGILLLIVFVSLVFVSVLSTCDCFLSPPFITSIFRK